MDSKITKYKDIPTFIRDGSWECDYDILGLHNFIQELLNDERYGAKLDLNPDFQRHHVWTELQQIRFIEFFLRGGKTGRVIYLNHPSWQGCSRTNSTYNEFVIVDGKQRLRAVERFVNNEIKAFGSLISEFTDNPRFVNNTFRLNVNTLKTRAEVLQWYLDMNSGGTPHTNDEIEHVKSLLAAENK